MINVQDVLGLVGGRDLLPHRAHGLEERLVVHLGELQALGPEVLDGLALPVLEERPLVDGGLGAGLGDPLLHLGRLAGQELRRDQDGPRLGEEMKAGLGHVLHRLVDLGRPQRGVVDGGSLDHALLHRRVELGERQRRGVGAERAHRLDEGGILHHADLDALEIGRRAHRPLDRLDAAVAGAEVAEHLVAALLLDALGQQLAGRTLGDLDHVLLVLDQERQLHDVVGGREVGQAAGADAHLQGAELDALEQVALAAELGAAEHLHVELAARQLLRHFLELERAVLVRVRHRRVVRELDHGLGLGTGREAQADQGHDGDEQGEQSLHDVCPPGREGAIELPHRRGSGHDGGKRITRPRPRGTGVTPGRRSGSLHCRAATSGAIGSRHRNVAPPAALFSARIEPPCAVTIDRLIASPSPRPCRRNVTNGSNTCSSCSGGMPAPRSDTDSCTNPSSAWSRATAGARSPASRASHRRRSARD
jgi:hypothetical protein